ncbi:hypothetical protein BKA70DRAFT_1146185 [Coprinopsis sp. MPI-PUGE-AT-0042]|nr:hypothetical protein BKA70DRAFT_1146185 [Coprinopsis sp. MPI-PUGE-AT-0042]
MTETRAQKRSRLEYGPSSSSSTSDGEMAQSEEIPVETGWTAEERSETVWLSDGNVILQAGRRLFRVHKSVLSRHSTVFNDMFMMPQPLQNGDDTLDGCPVVKLEDGGSTCWEWLLELLYDGRENYPTGAKFGFHMLEDLLTLGDKYDFKSLRRDALGQFKASFPSHFHLVTSTAFPTSGFDLNEEKYNLCDVVELARRFQIESSLPALYYHILIQDDFPNILRTGLTPETEHYTPFEQNTLITLMIGRERIYEGMAKHQFRWLWPEEAVVPARGCSEYYSCPKSLKALQRKLWRPVPKVKRALEPFKRTFFAEGMCNVCASAVETEFKEGQRAFWEELPTYFDLPPWEELNPGPV